MDTNLRAEIDRLHAQVCNGLADPNRILILYTLADNAYNVSDLAKAIADDVTTSEGRSQAQDFVKSRITGKSAAELKPQIMSVLEDVGSLLDRKAPTDAASFKAWLKHTAEKVAEASTEGGFMGFGGVAVSDAEKATIADVARALRA